MNTTTPITVQQVGRDALGRTVQVEITSAPHPTDAGACTYTVVGYLDGACIADDFHVRPATESGPDVCAALAADVIAYAGTVELLDEEPELDPLLADIAAAITAGTAR